MKATKKTNLFPWIILGLTNARMRWNEHHFFGWVLLEEKKN